MRNSILLTRRLSVLRAPIQLETHFISGDENAVDELGEFYFYSNPASIYDEIVGEDENGGEKLIDDSGGHPLSSKADAAVIGSHVISVDPESTSKSDYDVNEIMGKPRAVKESCIKKSTALQKKNGIDNSSSALQKHGKSLRKRKQIWPNRPYFLFTISVAQVVTMCVSFYLSYRNTGSFIQTEPFNYLIGPGPGTLIQMGSRFSPCMKKLEIASITLHPKTKLACVPGMSIPEKAPTLSDGSRLCSLSEICSMGAGLSDPPNQYYRFASAILLHGGLVHLLMNLMMQIRTGFPLERSMGTWRIAIVYLISGVGGFIFSAIFTANTPTVGCSGALYGLIACCLLDLLQNWKLMLNPRKSLAIILFQIVISLMVGLFPYVDNYAHIGGFVFGLLSGLI